MDTSVRFHSSLRTPRVLLDSKSVFFGTVSQNLVPEILDLVNEGRCFSSSADLVSDVGLIYKCKPLREVD